MLLLSALLVAAAPLRAQSPPVTVACSSRPGERKSCPCNTANGVILVRSTGDSPCLLGKTWGYDDYGIWVSDGAGGEFLVAPGGPRAQGPALPTGPLATGPAAGIAVPTSETAAAPAGASGPDAAGAVEASAAKGAGPPGAQKKPEYLPNVGFRLYEGEKGEIYVRLMSYLSYLNQLQLDPSYIDYFGNTHEVKQRQDFQLGKFFLPFSGWFLTPKFRYYLYVWSSNYSQGEGAQVAAAGNLSWVFNRYVTLGLGWSALPCTRSTEGQFPYWLGVDDRLTADEFFRGSYTTGIWVKGELSSTVKYMAMLGNNLNQLGVSASKLDNGLNTQSFMLQWLPTTGEFGLWGTFGDYDDHQKVATRLAAHYTHSREDKQSQPGSDSIENTQIRLTDGNVIFNRNLFGPGINVNRLTYEMATVDGGVKYKGFSVEAEYYWRKLSNFAGDNTGGIADIDDRGYQLQTSAMVVPKVLQVYLSGSQIFGHYGDSSEVRAGLNWYFMKQRGLRFNAEWLHLDRCPVGYTAVPYPVGGNGDVYRMTIEMNF